jgi:hypothetical protein
MSSEKKKLRLGASAKLHDLSKRQRARLQHFMAHDERACTLGVTNTIMTAVIATRLPQHFWLWHITKSLFYIPWRYVRFRRVRAQLYLLDWCYVVTWLINIFALLALVTAASGPPAGESAIGRKLVIAGFAMASGPLAWSVFIFRNSLVFHDIDNLTSVFIHLSPLLLFWRLQIA